MSPHDPDPSRSVGGSSATGQAPAGGASANHVDWLEPILHRAAELLPAQAPLETFVHHNTLHAFQHLNFHDAVVEAHRRMGKSGYAPESFYVRAHRAGRIVEADLDWALDRHYAPGAMEPPPGLPRPRELAKLILLHHIAPETPAGLAWRFAEHHAATEFAADVGPAARRHIVHESLAWLRRVAEERPLPVLIALLVGEHPNEAATFAAFDERFGGAPTKRRVLELLGDEAEAASVAALWEATRKVTQAIARVSEPWRAPKRSASLRDAVLSVSVEDPDFLVHPIVTLLAGAFLDQGQAEWTMPDRTEGFLVAFRRVLAAGHAVRPAWLAGLGRRLRRWEDAHAPASEIVRELLDELGVAPADREAFIVDTLLRLPGFAGMFNRLEKNPAGLVGVPVRLAEFLAVRLTLDALALAEVGRRLGYAGALSGLGAHLGSLEPLARPTPPGDHDRAWPLFVLAQHVGVAAPQVARWTPATAASLMDIVNRLDEFERRHIWQNAYERHYREQILGAINAKRAQGGAVERPPPRHQVLFCLDDRSESLRRHFEELDVAHETFGVPGFYNLAIAYQGIDDPSTFPLCPVVIEPRHRVAEEPLSTDEPLARARRERIQRLTTLTQRLEAASRSVVWGPIIISVAGVVATLPMLANLFAPWIAGRVRKRVAAWLLPLPETRLAGAFREGPGGALGFTVEEKVDRVATLLENVGLTKSFARIVALLGHDSSSVNNPHVAAYSCGACGGRSGGPNARLFAQMANKPEVRAGLRERGIDIPDTTWFVGGVHDTSADRVSFFDLSDAPLELVPELDELDAALRTALAHNAHERCRRFASAPRRPTPDEAARHVEGRSYDLSQARPELGHATNAACIVGRRALSAGLFLDRRAFLASYEPSLDDESGKILERILSGVGPVCAGINLEYFFSTTDNEGFGAGTKLPHNVTGLFGVLNGPFGDLRPGLPRQMIEIHEPIRLELIVEAPCARLDAVLARLPVVRELVANEWVALSSIDPDSGAIHLYRAGRAGLATWEAWHATTSMRLPIVGSSRDWYAGHAGLLPPALVSPARSLHEDDAPQNAELDEAV
ncbi:MAG: DUF2309 domain-containing protein [Polyangiaceae bacterium]